MLYMMQRHGRRIYLPIVLLILWVAFITFTGELTLLMSSSKKSRRPLYHAKAPNPFGKLAEDRIWRERIVKNILSTIKFAKRNNDTGEDVVNLGEKLKPVVKENEKKYSTQIVHGNVESELTVHGNNSKATDSHRSTFNSETLDKTRVNNSVRVDALLPIISEKPANLTANQRLNSSASTNIKDRDLSSVNFALSTKDGIADRNSRQNVTFTVGPDSRQSNKKITGMEDADPSTQNTNTEEVAVLRGAIRNNKVDKEMATKATKGRAGSKSKLLMSLNNSSIHNGKVEQFKVSQNETTASYSGVTDPNLFSKDYVPDVYKDITVNETIHFCVVAAQKGIAKEVEILVKSILVHARRSDVMFHFVTDNGPHEHIAKIFEDFDHPFVNISYEIIKTDLKTYLNRQFGNTVKVTSPWSGIYGLGKIFMYDLLPDVDRCIVVDTDVVFAADLVFLWHELQSRLQPPVAIAVTMKKGDNYFNSGLMLQNLELMRNISFRNLISMDACETVQNQSVNKYRCEHDQLLLNSVKKQHPKLFDTFTVSWNLGLCFNFRNFTFNSFEDKKNDLFFGAAHFSCISLKYNNAFEGFRHMSKWDNLRKYINYLEETDFTNARWKENIM